MLNCPGGCSGNFCVRYPLDGIATNVAPALRRSQKKVPLSFDSLSSWRFAFGFGEEFFGLDFVATAVDGGDEVVFGEEVDEHGEIFVVHDNN